MKWGVAWRNVKRYVKHNLREIAFLSSLSNPPHVEAKPKSRKLAFKDYIYIVRTAASLHAKSFTREGLTKEDGKNAGLEEFRNLGWIFMDCIEDGLTISEPL